MKKVFVILLALIALIVVSVLFFFKSDTKNPYEKIGWGRFNEQSELDKLPDDFGKDMAKCDYSVPEAEIPTFKEIDFPFSNQFDNTKSLPLMAAAMIDLDNDGVDEVFVSGGITQEDAIFKYTENGFVDISKSVELPEKPAGKITFGASSFDLDNDGNTDLILTGDYGVLWYRNTGSSFESQKIDAPLNEKSSAVTTTIGDFNRDGHADIFLCAYLYLDKMEGQTIFKDKNYGGSSLLLQNNGDNTFSDVMKSIGLEYIHNTFQAVFVDIDNDNWLDLVVAYDTGEARTYKNQKGKKFKLMSNPLTGKYAYPMGIAVGDYNNDNLIDFFFSNTGSSVPKFLARGDLAEEDEFNEKWLLFKNEGDFKFTDVAKETKVADFEFSWGAIFEDFNLDGRQDLVVAENYVDFPPHSLFKLPCRFLLQRPDGTFAAVEEQAGVINNNYAIAPLTSDFNKDGYPDLMYSNLNGKVKAFINKGGEHNFIAFRFPENAEYVGSRITLSLGENQILSDVYVIGEGLGSDQSSTITFGLGKKKELLSATITLPSGEKIKLDKPTVNQVHLVKK
jgi:hypothetical protein